MVRFGIIGIVIAVAFTLYSLVDAAMTDGARARGVAKPVWVVLIVVLPVIGGILWFVIGKGDAPAARPAAPDDDPRFSGTRMSSGDLDAHMRDLEDRLRELDEETFPGEQPGAAPRSGGTATDASAETSTGSTDNSASGDTEPGSADGPGPASDSGTQHPQRDRSARDDQRRDGGSQADGDASQP
ncbi:PLDc N-terminal domain-containing protein [Leucobacter chromiireducens]|uniref:PLDc N-terminal domain-containing protein n=1 Tax=Leucobacter chromiireducens TaxID=283877 RepID=UPI001F151D7F|nr:PLDc N-terminal domain-containing protein [Leucobacter chromiireducens]